MIDVSDDEFGLVTGPMGGWVEKWDGAIPEKLLLSQTDTVAWECGNDSQYSQTHLSSCQGPIESVKLHQQV